MKMLHVSMTRPLSGLIAALTLSVAMAAVARASVIDLGAAAGYSVLTYNSANTSDSAFQGAPIGVVNGNWVQSGGAQTNTQQPTTVFLSPGFTNSGPAVETTVINGPQLTAAWSAAQSASASFAAMTPTQILGAITTNTTITEAAVGNYVLSISNISLNHPASLTLSAPAGSTFVLNISGDVTINGSAGSGLLLAGGLTSNDVVYNFTGGGSLTTAGGMSPSGGTGGSLIQGIILDPNGSVGLHPGGVQGEVIAQTFSSSSGAQVTGTPPPSIPEASALFPLLGVLGMVVAGPMIRRKFLAAA